MSHHTFVPLSDAFSNCSNPSDRYTFVLNSGQIVTRRFGTAELKYQILCANSPESYPLRDVSAEDISKFKEVVLDELKMARIADNPNPIKGLNWEKAIATGIIFAGHCLPDLDLTDSRCQAIAYFVAATALHDDGIDMENYSLISDPEEKLSTFHQFNAIVLKVLKGDLVPPEIDLCTFQLGNVTLLFYKLYVVNILKTNPKYFDNCGPFLKEFTYFLNTVSWMFEKELQASRGLKLLFKDITYAFMRKGDIGSSHYTESIALAYGLTIWEEQRALPQFKGMMDALALGMGYANDLISFKKEFDYTYEYEGEYRSRKNAVTMHLLKKDGKGIGGAIKKVQKMANAEIEDFVQFGDDCVKQCGFNKDVVEFVKIARWFMDGGVLTQIENRERYLGHSVERVSVTDFRQR